jgi:hypothetical protein
MLGTGKGEATETPAKRAASSGVASVKISQRMYSRLFPITTRTCNSYSRFTHDDTRRDYEELP